MQLKTFSNFVTMQLLNGAFCFGYEIRFYNFEGNVMINNLDEANVFSEFNFGHLHVSDDILQASLKLLNTMIKSLPEQFFIVVPDEWVAVEVFIDAIVMNQSNIKILIFCYFHRV